VVDRCSLSQDSPKKDARGSGSTKLHRTSSNKQYKPSKVSIRTSATPPPSPAFERDSSSESDSEDSQPTGKGKKKLTTVDIGSALVGDVDIVKKVLENLEEGPRSALLEKKRRSSASPCPFDRDRHKIIEDPKKERIKDKEKGKEKIIEKIKEDREYRKSKDEQRHSLPTDETGRHPELRSNSRSSIPSSRLSTGKVSPNVTISPTTSQSGSNSPASSPHIVDLDSKLTASEMEDSSRGPVFIQKVSPFRLCLQIILKLTFTDHLKPRSTSRYHS
jgi:hypothetical protein